MKKTITTVVAVSVMSSVSFAQETGKGSAKSGAPTQTSTNASGQKASKTVPITQKGQNAKSQQTTNAPAPKSSNGGPVKPANAAKN